MFSASRTLVLSHLCVFDERGKRETGLIGPSAAQTARSKMAVRC